MGPAYTGRSRYAYLQKGAGARTDHYDGELFVPPGHKTPFGRVFAFHEPYIVVTFRPWKSSWIPGPGSQWPLDLKESEEEILHPTASQTVYEGRTVACVFYGY